MTDPDKMLAWLRRSKHRLCLFRTVVRLNKAGVHPSASSTMDRAAVRFQGTVVYWSQSSITNGYTAIAQMLNEGWLVDMRADKRGEKELAVGPTIDVIGDMLEEQGRPRLKREDV